MRVSSNGMNKPDLRLDIYLVKIGYQIDYFENGKWIMSECRDFGGSHPVTRLKREMYQAIQTMLDKFRETH